MIKMKVNGIDISEYGAELIDRAASTQVIKSITDWLDGSVQGTLLRQSYDYKSIKVTFVVKAENEDNAYKQISKLTEALKKCCIKFEDIDLVFPCILNGAALPERLQNGVFRIIYLLSNDWGIGDTISLSFDIPQVSTQELKVKYIENWATTAKGYAQCYDEDEIYKTIAEETVYIESGNVAQVASESDSWNSFFLALGVDIDKYKPETNNTLNGFVDIKDEYSEAGAVELMSKENRINIYYNRFQKKGLADLPLDTDYPSLVWQAPLLNGYYIDTGVGKDWNVQDISVIVYGRWFGGGGSMFGAGPQDGFTLALDQPNAKWLTSNTINPSLHQVFESDAQSGKNFIIVTLEDITAVPLRKYGFRSSKEGDAPVDGYVDIIFNGVTLTRDIINDVVLENNIKLMDSDATDFTTGQECEIARAQIYYKGELVRDLIPIAGNVKNGFVNTFDTGFYDTITMTYLPWIRESGNKVGPKPNEIMEIPVEGDTPLPPAPPEPEIPKYIVTVVNGTGSGEYQEGDAVVITADAPQPNYQFTGWTVNTGNVVITNPTSTTTGFTMPAGDVTVTAAYQEIPVTPEILYYSSLSRINNETTKGENAGTWAESTYSGDGPSPYEYFVAVYSVPSTSGQWSIYSSSYYSMSSQGKDKWGRPYIEFEVTTGKSKTGQYITYTPTGGSAVRKDFCIKSL